MAKIYTEQPIMDAGIHAVNFFNGRLLTAEDLTAEQTANVQGRRLLGQALGDGVAKGLFVSLSGKAEDFTVSVDAGLAVNRRGDVLRLAEAQELSLTGSLKSPGAQAANIFADCTQTPTGQFTPTGLYLLTISPAAAGEGRAPTSGLGNTSAPCNTRYIVQGVKFHLIRLSTPAISAQLRNILAYQSFGFLPASAPLNASGSPLVTALEHPFAAPPAGYGLLDALSPDKYPICHVPLALIFTTAGRIDFVDNWSVRRSVTAPTATQPWQAYLSPRRRSEAQAAFLQFQEHLASLVAAKTITSAYKAANHFKLLPPVGLLPGKSSGLDWRAFLGVHAPAYETRVDSGLLAGILEDALACSPFVVEDTNRPPAAVDVYAIPGDAGPFVKQIATSLASQLEQVDHDTLFRLLDLKPAEGGFVLFARARRGRIRVSFTTKNVTPSKAIFSAAATESSLEMAATPTAGGDLVFPDVDAGYYLVKGSIQGFKPILPGAAEVIGGQVTTMKITPVPFDLKLCMVVEEIARLKLSRLRFCLVEGTFEAALALAKYQPWANYQEVDLKDTQAYKQLLDWRSSLGERYPDFDIEKSEPQLVLASAAARSGARKTNTDTAAKALAGAVVGAPENPLAYVVFGKVGFPLTVVTNTNINRDPIPLQNLLRQAEKARTLAMQTTMLSLLKKLVEYGILFVEQAAGGWTDLIMDAAGVSKTQASLIIETFASELSQIDQK